MYEHNALGYWSGLTLCLTKVRSSRARCPATALIEFNEYKICACTCCCILVSIYSVAYRIALHVSRFISYGMTAVSFQPY